MKEILTSILIGLTTLSGWLGIHKENPQPTSQPNVGAFSDPYLSVQVGTSPVNGYYLTTDGTNSTWAAVAGGGGGGGGTFSTSTAFGTTLLNYPNNATDVVMIGSVGATSTAKFWFNPNTSTSFLTYASSTALTATNLFATNFTLGTLSGILKASSGVVSTAVSGTDLKTINGSSIIGSGDLTISGGSGNVATSSVPSIGNLAFWTSTTATPATLGTVATSSVTINAPLTSAGTAGYVVGGSGWTIDIDDIKAVDLDLTDITLNDFTNDTGFTTFAWPFTANTGYVSTSTVLGLNGFFSTASSTISGDLHTALSDGFAYIGSGILKSVSTSTALSSKQDTLVSGTNIKTINGSSVLGSGDLTVVGATALASSSPWTFGSLVVAKDNGSVTTISTSTIKTSQLTNDAGFITGGDVTANETDPVWTGVAADYVPYTGGINDLDLGNNNLTATTLKSKSSVDLQSGSALDFYSDAGITRVGGLTVVDSAKYEFADTSYTNKGILDFSGITTSNKTFTFPNKSLTIAGINDETFTGLTSMSYSSSTIYSSFVTASTSALVASNSVNIFGGGAKTTANALCIQLTGSADLCDGSDASGAGGSGVGTISTSTTPTIGNLSFWTSSGAYPDTLGTVATTTLTATSPLSLSQTVVKVGGSNSVITIATTTNSLFTGTAGQVLGYTGAGWTGVATTTFSGGLTYASGNVTDTTTAGDGLTRTVDDFDCDIASGSVFGCLSTANWTTFNGKAETSSAMTGTFDGNNFAGGAIGAGEMLYGASAGSITELALGASSTVLTTNGTIPIWQDIVSFIKSTINSASMVLTGTWDFSGATVKQHLYPAFSYATSTAWTATTTIYLAPAYQIETWNAVKCETDAGTLNVSFYDASSNRMNLINASTTIGTFNFSTNNSFTAGESRRVDIGTPASSPTRIACSVDKTIN